MHDYSVSYLLHSLAGNILQFESVEPLLFCQRGNHLSSCCSHLLQHCHHTGLLAPALCQRL